MDSMECVDPNEQFNTVSDEGPAEHAVVWVAMIAGCLLFWALVIYGLIQVFS